MLKMKVIEMREYPRQGTADVTLEYGPARKKLTLEMVGIEEFSLGQELVLIPETIPEALPPAQEDAPPPQKKHRAKKDDDA
jgi:hypothetical protein